MKENKNEICVIDLIRKLEKLDGAAPICFDGRDLDLAHFPDKENKVDGDYYYFLLAR